MIDKIYEHLKTRRKYNTLQLKYDVKCDELEHKIMELATERKVRVKQKELMEARINELVEESLKQKEQIIKLKKELKELKNEK